MKKLKKIYCRTSFAFGTMTLIIALFLMFGQSAYATGSNSSPYKMQDNNNSCEGREHNQNRRRQ